MDVLSYEFAGWSGRDLWRYLMPERMQAGMAARRLMVRGIWRQIDPSRCHHVITMPGGKYRVTAWKSSRAGVVRRVYMQPFSGPRGY